MITPGWCILALMTVEELLAALASGDPKAEVCLTVTRHYDDGDGYVDECDESAPVRRVSTHGTAGAQYVLLERS